MAHRWWTFDFASARPPRPEEVLEAIAEVAAAMLRPPISNVGVAGIATAAEVLPSWPAMLTGAQMREACANAFVMIDATGGTGGGLFRYMYARFLREAAAIADRPALAAVSDGMQDAGDPWQEVAELLRAAADRRRPTILPDEAAEHLLAIGEREREIWAELDGLASATPWTRRSRPVGRAGPERATSRS